MKEDKYSVIVDNEKIAQHMTLEIASILVRALCEKWYEESNLVISIARESEEEK